MNARPLFPIVCALCLSVVAFAAAAAAAGEGEGKAAGTHEGHGHDQEAMMQEIMEKYGTPGPEHAYMEPLVGSFKYESSFWMEPGMEPERSTGSSEYSWVHGGRFLKQTAEGQVMGQSFTGTGIMGYDRFNKEAVSVWFDNMGTGVMMSTGAIDATGKIFTFEGTVDDVWTGEKDQWVKSVLRIEDENQHVFTMYAKGPDGKEFKNFELVYTRQDVAGN